MNNKKKLGIFLILVLALSLAIGTFAYYSKTFASDENKIRAAKFEVDSNGTLNGNEMFDLTDRPIYPGVEQDIYEFEIDKKNTEVPVKYNITVTPYDELFKPVAQGDSPVNITVLRKVDDNWVDIGGLENVEIVPKNMVEEFKIHMKWEHSDYDIEYQGKPGKVKMNVVATQVDGEVNPDPDPDPDPERPDMTVWYFKWGKTQYIMLESIDIEGAESYQITVNGKKLGNINEIGKVLPAPIGTPHPIDAVTLHVYSPRPWDGRPRQLLWEGEIKNPEFRGEFRPDPYE